MGRITQDISMGDSDDPIIRVHYEYPGVTGSVSDFITFHCDPSEIDFDINSRAVQSASKAQNVDPSKIKLNEMEYRE